MIFQNNLSVLTRKKEILILLFVLTAVFFSFSSALFNDFVTWDDRIHVLDNPSVSSLNPQAVISIFKGVVNRTYIPLTTFSFAVERHFFGLSPFVYHLDNLLLHLSVTALVFFLGMRLGLNARASGLVSLVFGIHPMHVESVAWVTERKNVLYAFFYMLALLSYWHYLVDPEKACFRQKFFENEPLECR